MNHYAVNSAPAAFTMRNGTFVDLIVMRKLAPRLWTITVTTQIPWRFTISMAFVSRTYEWGAAWILACVSH
jgi:hypothetical protein